MVYVYIGGTFGFAFIIVLLLLKNKFVIESFEKLQSI